MSNISVMAMQFRFTRPQVEMYHDMFVRAHSAGRKFFIVATPEARKKIEIIFPLEFSEEEMGKLVVHNYPTSVIDATKLARGLTNVSVLFIDDRGRFADDIKQAIAWCENTEVTFVFNNDHEYPDR